MSRARRLVLALAMVASPAVAAASATGDCRDCHTTTTWSALPPTLTATSVPDFAHDRDTAFALRGGHGALPCAACHRGIALAGRGAVCVDCHASPHPRVRNTRCDDCHGEGGWQVPPQPDAHRESTFPLVGAHRALPCESCHRADPPGAPEPVPQRCSACHRGESLAAGVHPDHRAAGFLADCRECHSEAGWRPAQVQHDAFWPLTGRHRTAACSACHPTARYGGTPRECVGCHRDDYEATSAPAHRAAGFSTRCESCHTSASAWSRTSRGFHDRHFPLRGPHATGCDTCHPDTTAQFTCFACHEHSQSRTNAEHGEVGGYRYESTACLRCHRSGEGD